MTPEKCKDLIRERIKKYKNDNLRWPGNESWYDGIQRGLLDALELVGMIDKENK